MASLFVRFPCCFVVLAIPVLVNAKPFSFAVCYMAPVACNNSLVLVFGCCSLLVWFLFCSGVFLVWSSFLFHCMTTAFRTVYGSFISTTIAAHHQQDGSITMPELMEHVACQ